ncbi:feline leukemia virus subgroup C receptor-related protein 2-like isoform X2 [Gigantopelta aegis]|uniref:feline leukemia virus subgroup C receptor-related protein 2-like isoform X2 n=1 Tax=Gigantopelta aegis TaxID=1735272 RepID=UPI001B88BA67|nr:feline leukemia virus subgroup C receptor-related protein 2-like isoform X2 [Gigantopelta aegis]
MGQSSGKASNVEYRENGDVTLLPTMATTPTTPSEPERSPLELREDTSVYTRRWVMLLLFCMYSMSSAYQWIHLNIIGNTLMLYYNESLPGDSFQQETAIDWLSMIYMLAYIPLIVPATWLLDKKGIRICNIVGSCLNCIGAWLKCASVSPDRFPLLMFAQTICAVAQLFVLGIPARLAAVWFGPNEVSTATSFGVFGNQIGVAIGFLIPPVLVANSIDLKNIGFDLTIMFYGGAAFTTIIFIAMIIVFQAEPPSPPSLARKLASQSHHSEQYLQSLFRLLQNCGFILLVISYGINTGCYYAISTLLNPIVLFYFEGEGENAGRIGLTIILMGVLGAIVAGIWLDRTKMFKATSVGIYLMSMVGMLVFTFTVSLGHIWIVFVTAGSLGLFMTGYLPVGFEFAAEITFPESEGTSSGLLNASAQFFGIVFTIGMRAMINKISMLSANLTASAVLLAGTIMTVFIKADYRRQAAGEVHLYQLIH